MKKTLTILWAILCVTFSSSAFAQQAGISESILTIGIYESANCGLVNSADRATSQIPEDETSEKVRERIAAENIGTGFIYSYNGKKYVITCEHVIFKAGKIIGHDSAFNEYELKLVGGDTFYDVAVLEFVNPNDAKQFESIQFETQLPNTNEEVQSIGYWNLENVLMSFSGKVLDSSGILKNSDLPVAKLGFIKSTAKLPKGFSGGVLLNLEDKVLGMNILRKRNGSDYYALQSNIVKRIVEDVINDISNHLVDVIKVKRAFTGIQFAQNMKGGVVKINEIISNSPAAEHRDQLENQSIKSINGNPISDIYSVLQIMENIRPGTPITIELNDSKYNFVSVLLEREQLRQIAEHAVQYHPDIAIRGEAIIVNMSEKEEVATIAGMKNNLVYCLNNVEQLGEVVRIFGLHRRLKIGTSDNIKGSGRNIYFSDDGDMRVLYY